MSPATLLIDFRFRLSDLLRRLDARIRPPELYVSRGAWEACARVEAFTAADYGPGSTAGEYRQ